MELGEDDQKLARLALTEHSRTPATLEKNMSSNPYSQKAVKGKRQREGR